MPPQFVVCVVRCVLEFLVSSRRNRVLYNIGVSPSLFVEPVLGQTPSETRGSISSRGRICNTVIDNGLSKAKFPCYFVVFVIFGLSMDEHAKLSSNMARQRPLLWNALHFWPCLASNWAMFCYVLFCARGGGGGGNHFVVYGRRPLFLPPSPP